MDRKTFITLGAITLLIIGAFAVLLLNSDTKQAMKNTVDQTSSKPMASSSKTAVEPQTADSQPTASPGSYVAYSPEALAKAEGEKLIFFHAPWCPQCRDLEADIEQGVPSGVTIFKVDYDTNQQLRQKYGVTIQTTVVKVDKDGNLIKRYVAYNEPKLDAVISNLL